MFKVGIEATSSATPTSRRRRKRLVRLKRRIGLMSASIDDGMELEVESLDRWGRLIGKGS